MPLKIKFEPTITFGNICQILTIVFAGVGYLIHNEVRATKQQAAIENHEQRIQHVEAAVEYPLYNRTNTLTR